MTPKYKSFADALSTPAAIAANRARPKAANDNKPVRYRGTLPALRWLYDNRPDLAPAMADAVKSLSRTEWNEDAADGAMEFRPTIGEIVRAASAGEDVNGNVLWLKPEIERTPEKTKIRLGALKFDGNALTEYGQTRKGRKLEPRERLSVRGKAPGGQRNPNGYLWLKGAVPSPLRADPYQRPFSGEPALIPMYDPQRGVEANRAELREHGVDGSVPFDRLPFPATKGKPAIADGAEFLGGVVGSSGNSSSGAVMWESRSVPKGEVRRVVEAVASGATLKDIGERMGIDGTRVDRGAKELLVEAARTLQAANDNAKKKNAA
jgi:hypothetical protein